jgi:ubiquinone/menaquinone biosynthesis C-methylase UbiE
MNPHFDPIQYKINSKENWNVVAHDYHKNWADKHEGPFKSSIEIVHLAEVKPNDKVLDLACGTGAVSKEIIRHLNKDGLLVGVDLSRTALSIARKSIQNPNADFLEMDAENIAFNFIVDKVLCQYGLMFFPNVRKVLESVRNILRENGKLVIAVHGSQEEVPYFSSIMKPILKHIPNIRPEGTPTVHRFGDPNDLRNELLAVGFTDISIKKLTCSHEIGTFEEYWQDYMRSTANSIRPKIESSGSDVISKIKIEAEQNTSMYIKDGRITFPWIVLIACASR